MPLYAGKYAICAFLQNMRNMLRRSVRYSARTRHAHARITARNCLHTRDEIDLVITASSAEKQPASSATRSFG